MKFSTTGNSKLLRQENVHAPFVAIIQDVRVENLKDKRGIEGRLRRLLRHRPMKFNVINRKTVVAAYGDQREAWIGKQVEIYVDPMSGWEPNAPAASASASPRPPRPR